MDKNSNLTREQKIEKVIREGHEIAEKMRKINTSEDLSKLVNEYEAYYAYVAENFGYNKGTFAYDKYSDLNDFLAVAMSFVADCASPHTEELEVLRQGYIDDFEECLDYGDWRLKGDSHSE